MSNLIGGEEVAHIEALASMDNWEQFMEFASDQIDQAIPDQSQSYKLKLAYEELISNIIRATNKDLSAGTTPAIIEILALKNVWDGHNVFVLRTQDTGPHLTRILPIGTALILISLFTSVKSAVWAYFLSSNLLTMLPMTGLTKRTLMISA